MIQTHAPAHMSRLSALTLTTLAGILGISAFAESASAAVSGIGNDACSLGGADAFGGNILREYTSLGNGDITQIPFNGTTAFIPRFGSNCGTVTQLGIAQGRPGKNWTQLNGDYEIGLSSIGANRTNPGGVNPDVIQLNWVAGTTYSWTLGWNPTTNTATFTVTDPRSLVGTKNSATFTLADLPFNGFLIESRADANLDTGSTFNFSVLSITTNTGGTQTGNLTTTAIDGAPRFDAKWFVLNDNATGIDPDTEITSMSGTFSFSGSSNCVNPTGCGSSFGFNLQLLDPIDDTITPTNGTTTPEASSSVGLMLIGFLGLAGLRQGNKA
jgi:hypothetical protein